MQHDGHSASPSPRSASGASHMASSHAHSMPLGAMPQKQASQRSVADPHQPLALDADGRNVTAVRMRPAEFFARVLAHQLCTAICQAVPDNYNSKRLLADGSRLLRNAFGLWDMFMKPDAGHSDAINLCWDQDPGLAHPHSLPVMPPIMEATERCMRLQVSTVAPSEEAMKGCCDALNPTCDVGPPSGHGLQLATVVLSTHPENSSSTQLFMGAEAPPDTAPLDCPQQGRGTLTIAVYQAESRIAHAVVPLDQVWEAIGDGAAGSAPIAAQHAAEGYLTAPSHGAAAGAPWPGPATPWPGPDTNPYPALEQPTAPEESTHIPAAEYPVPAHFQDPATPRGALGRTGELHTSVVAPRQQASLARHAAPRAVKRCPYCRSWFARFKAGLVCGTCRHCMGTRIYRDPFGDDLAASVFDPEAHHAFKSHAPSPRLENPLWWLTKGDDGVHILHATLTNPNTGKLSGVISVRCWVTGGEPRLAAQASLQPHMPLAAAALPSQQVQLSVMQLYRITMQSALRASGCSPRKLNPDEPWSWLLGQFIAQHRIPAPSVHLCWLQWYLQDDIRSLLPEALDMVRNKVEVLKGTLQLGGFERTQFDGLQLDALRLVEFAFQRYYRLDCSAERGLCERHTRSAERVAAALRPAVALAQHLKDLCHPQDQAWMRHLLSDAALNRFKHLEAASGLRANAAPAVERPRAHHLQDYGSMANMDDDKRDAWSQPPAGMQRVADMQAWMEQQRLDKDQLTAALATLCDGVKHELKADLTIHREHILPAPILLPVVTAEVYSRSLSNLIVYLLEKVRPDPTAAATTTVVAIAKLETFLRAHVFAAFNQEQPFSAHALLETTVTRWLDATRGELLGQLRAAGSSARGVYVAAAPTPGCEVQDALLPALRNRLRVYEAIVTNLPLTATLVEKMATDVIRETMLASCKLHGMVRRGQATPKFGGGSTGVDVAANMRRDGWMWQTAARDYVPNTGLRRAEIVMLNALRRLLSTISSLSADLTRWGGGDAMPQLQAQPRINVFHGRAATGPPMGLAEYGAKAVAAGSDLYSSPSMNGVRGGRGMHSHTLSSPAADGCMLPGPPGMYKSSPAPSHFSPSPHPGAADGDSDTGGVIPFGVNFAQLNKEIRHVYSFVVIETAHRAGDQAIGEAGGMQRIIEGSGSSVPAAMHAPYAVGPRPVAGDARVLCAQRLHDALQQLLQGMRRVLEDKAFIALTRGVWDHIGSRAYDCLQNLANGRDNPRAWRTQQGVEHMLADMEDFFKQSLQSFVQDSSLVPRDLSAPARFIKARDLVSSAMGSNSFQPI